MPFDFTHYLSILDPSPDYTIDVLTGGVINFTVRATKVKGHADKHNKGRFAEQNSLVLKQAPPYMAGVGASAPISQYRQVSQSSQT